jgi:hypothetical protein
MHRLPSFELLQVCQAKRVDKRQLRGRGGFHGNSITVIGKDNISRCRLGKRNQARAAPARLEAKERRLRRNRGIRLSL